MGDVYSKVYHQHVQDMIFNILRTYFTNKIHSVVKNYFTPELSIQYALIYSGIQHSSTSILPSVVSIRAFALLNDRRRLFFQYLRNILGNSPLQSPVPANLNHS